MMGQLYNNLSAALLACPDSDPKKALKYAEEAISRFPRNEKAWHRKAMALYRMGDASESLETFTRCLEMSATGVADAKTKTVMADCERIVRLRLEKEKKVYQKMFN